MKYLIPAILFVVGACLAGCSSKEATTSFSAEERFQHAKALFDDENYLEAINEFTVVTLQFQASPYADDAQYYLGECRFMRPEYLLAANEYGILKRNMAASPLVPDAQYKIGLCYYNLAPKASLTQENTKKAIDEFQTYVEYYPGGEHATEADAKIRELTKRLAQKQYEAGILYVHMEYYRSAISCFDDVIEKYHDTEYAPLAFLGKIEALVARRKFLEADAELKKFYDRFPNNVLRSQADKLRERVNRELESKGQVSGKESGSSEKSGNAAEVLPGTKR
jgi:outer membrane protein assembly factor BamD